MPQRKARSTTTEILQKRPNEALLFRDLLGEDAMLFSERPVTERDVAGEKPKRDVWIAAMVDEVHQVDVDSSQSLKAR